MKFTAYKRASLFIKLADAPCALPVAQNILRAGGTYLICKVIILVVHPNKPILFSVEHIPSAVEKELSRFRETVKGKTFLFVELIPGDIEQILQKHTYSIIPSIKAYQRLVAEASRGGMKIIALDNNPKFNTEADVAETQAMIGGSKADIRRWLYEIYTKREKGWIERLQGVGSNAVLVMHPKHSTEIAKQLKIPKENIIGKLLNADDERAIAENIVAQIWKKRIARKLAKAKRRFRRLPK